MRPCLVEVIQDTTDTYVKGGLGWYAPIHDEVRSQGGTWTMFAYWGEAPRSLSVTGKPFNAVCLVDVPDFDAITSGYVLPLDIAGKSEFMQFIQGNPASILPAPIKNKLRKDGFDDAGTIYQMLEGILV